MEASEGGFKVGEVSPIMTLSGTRCPEEKCIGWIKKRRQGQRPHRSRQVSFGGRVESVERCAAAKGSFPHHDAHGNCREEDTHNAEDELRHPELCEGVDSRVFGGM